ncbi:MAG: hypothetical protein M3443_03355 [Actinomycetota bacterium]|nr:hypothetical protein [Actinomycetota bacterium]
MDAPTEQTVYIPIQSDTLVVLPQPRFVDSLGLVALPTAVNCARIFITTALHNWNIPAGEARALALVTDLVTHAVKATGPPNGVAWHALDHLSPITIRLLGYERSIVIEVYDTATETAVPAGHRSDGRNHADAPPEPPPPREECQTSGDLARGERAAERWGASTTPTGQVTWVELAVQEQTAAELPFLPQTGGRAFQGSG